MTDAAIAELQKVNLELCHLVMRLGKIILRLIVEQRGLPAIHDSDMPLRLPAELTPLEIVTAFRELAVRCDRLTRRSGDGRSSQTLESLSTEFAVAAEDLEAIFGIAVVDEVKS